MANQSEVDVDVEEEMLRMKIEESREALTSKIEQLEEKVTETVESATASVAEVTANVMETVQSATASVTETVDSVTTAVQGTVDNVRHSVEGTVDSVKEAFDLSLQVKRQPWLMLAASVAAGYFGTRFLIQSAPKRPSKPILKRPSPPEPVPETTNWNRATPSTQALQSRGSNGFQHIGEPIGGEPVEVPSTPPHRNWIDHLTSNFGPEVSKIEGLVIGTAMGAIKDLVLPVAPQPLKQPLAELIDQFTQKAGGQPLQGNLFTTPSAGSR